MTRFSTSLNVRIPHLSPLTTLECEFVHKVFSLVNWLIKSGGNWNCSLPRKLSQGKITKKKRKKLSKVLWLIICFRTRKLLILLSEGNPFLVALLITSPMEMAEEDIIFKGEGNPLKDVIQIGQRLHCQFCRKIVYVAL